MASSITLWEYFYDGQQRRYLEQIVRTYSGFQYETGTNGQGAPQLVVVPCTMALTNQLVAAIQANNSENVLQTCPRITIWQTGLRGRKEDVQNPSHIDHLQVTERKIVDGRYTSEKGNSYSVDRLMPMPMTMDIQVDLWTSNLDQKYQLMEQMLIATQFQFEIQNSENAIDWSAATYCFLEEDIAWSSRQIPIGTSSELDIATLKLRIPMFLNPPAKVKRISRVEQIVTPIAATPSNTPFSDGDIEEIVANVESPSGDRLLQSIVTPDYDFWIMVNSNIITLRSDRNGELLQNGQIPSWVDLFKKYGILVPTVSTIRLALTEDIEGAFVFGTIQYGSEQNELIWTIDADTLPANTLLPIDAIIDPLKSFPGVGLPPAVTGQRYMLVNDIGNTVAWGSLSAEANDIIQYNGTNWVVVFDSCNKPSVQYVLNLHTGSQLLWSGTEWEFSINRYYAPGYWRINL